MDEQEEVEGRPSSAPAGPFLRPPGGEGDGIRTRLVGNARGSPEGIINEWSGDVTSYHSKAVGCGTETLMARAIGGRHGRAGAGGSAGIPWSPSNLETSPRLPPEPHPGVCGATVTAIAALALVGWLTGWRSLAEVRSGYIPMAPNTAIGMIACGLGLATFPGGSGDRSRPSAPGGPAAGRGGGGDRPASADRVRHAQRPGDRPTGRAGAGRSCSAWPRSAGWPC